MSDAALLNVVLYLPVLGMLLIAALPRNRDDLVRWLSFAVMVAQLWVTWGLYDRFDPAEPGLQFETRLPWIADWGVYYQIGLDGYNVLLVLLTAFLGPLVVAGAF
nr:NADH-quinone oxidoreductase subunit M [Burkholderiales bacterium]